MVDMDDEPFVRTRQEVKQYYRQQKLTDEPEELVYGDGFGKLEQIRFFRLRAGELSLAIVGSREWPSKYAVQIVQDLINTIVQEIHPTEIVSGGAYGVDTWAEETGDLYGIDKKIYRPTDEEMRREGYGKFEPRNRRIAKRCDALVRIRSNSSRTKGSEATARYTEDMGKIVARFGL